MSHEKPMVLIVDDEQVVCDVLYEELGRLGYLCTTTTHGNEALAKIKAQDVDVALLDIKLPGISGVDLLDMIHSHYSNIVVIMITGVDNVETAVRAIKSGASDYIVKPFSLDRVITSIRAALDGKYRSLQREAYKTAPCIRDLGHEKQTIEEPSTHIDAIALGIEAKLDSIDRHSKTVIRRTIEVARQLDISEAEIQRWVDARSTVYSERDKIIKSVLSKVERSPLMQCMMGMTALYVHREKSDGTQN